MRRRLKDNQVQALKPRPARYTTPDPELVGHYVRVTPSGAKSFVAVARDPYGKQIWTTIGPTAHFKIEQARERARDIIARVKAGKQAVEPPAPAPDSFAVVAQNWIKRYVEPKGLRTRYEIERKLAKYVLPFWRDKPIAEIRRRDVAALLDHVEDHHGARMADTVLSVIRSIMNWYSSRDDDYVSPIVRGMKRCTNGARQRILNDAELQVIWRHADQGGQLGSLIQLALVSGQRLAKLLDMRWTDISADGIWSVPVVEREKSAGGDLALPEMALAILRRQPHILGTDLVFAPTRGKRLSPSWAKLGFEAGLPELPRWTIHDCRRTARSLMARAGVPDRHAEAVLGHAIKGVEQTYNRHSYLDEKRIALAKLAALISEIVNPPSGKVVPMRGRS